MVSPRYGRPEVEELLDAAEAQADPPISQNQAEAS